MIDRYILPRMGVVWSPKRKYETWLQVELAVCEAREERGEVPKGLARRIKRKVTIDPSRIEEIEPNTCLLYTSPSPRDRTRSRMPSSA